MYDFRCRISRMHVQRNSRLLGANDFSQKGNEFVRF